jgi:2-haloacid dehalogenase
MQTVEALFFDVFGTVVDWRTSIIREGEAFGRRNGVELDWARFADDWRALYKPYMQQVEDGERPWTVLDELHRLMLLEVLAQHGVEGVSDAEIAGFARAWRRLDPWPDSVDGLRRMKLQRIVAALSNGNVALTVAMARRAGLPWDMVFGAELAGHYKPHPAVYLTAARLLMLPPAACMMVAAHNDDLEAAAALGFQTAFVRRPFEHGPGQTGNLEPSGNWTMVAEDLHDLARKLN